MRKAIVGENQRHIGDQPVRVRNPRALDPLVAIGRDHALARAVDHDAGYRRGCLGHPHHAERADTLMGHLVDQLVADAVAGMSHRPRVVRLAAKPRQRDGGVHRASSGDHREFVGHALAARRREFRHAKHEVLHGDADAQDGGRAKRRGHRFRPSFG